mgnify:FL=1
MLRDSRGEIEFAVSEDNDRQQAIDHWKSSGLDVLDVIEVKVSVGMGYVAPIVIRCLASTPDGAEVLTCMLRAVVEHQKSWKKPHAIALHEQ